MKTWFSFNNIRIFKSIELLKRAVFRVTVRSGVVVEVSTNEFANALDPATRIVTHIAAASLNRNDHANGKLNLLSLLAGFDLTLPEATGSGDTYEFEIGIVPTSNDYGILALTTDILQGSVVVIDTDTVADSATGFKTAATSDKIEMNGTTKGALTIGDRLLFRDNLDATWSVSGQLTGSGTIVTPFAAT